MKNRGPNRQDPNFPREMEEIVQQNLADIFRAKMFDYKVKLILCIIFVFIGAIITGTCITGLFFAQEKYQMGLILLCIIGFFISVLSFESWPKVPKPREDSDDV